MRAKEVAGRNPGSQRHHFEARTRLRYMLFFPFPVLLGLCVVDQSRLRARPIDADGVTMLFCDSTSGEFVFWSQTLTNEQRIKI